MATLLTPPDENRDPGSTGARSRDARDRRDATIVLADAGPAEEFASEPSYVQGVSLSGILQMLNLERKTCVLEVVAKGKFGTLSLVNGELVDADSDGLEGEDAAFDILSWDRPQTTIMDGAALFRHTVQQPISRLLLESTRRLDEAARGRKTESRALIDRQVTAALIREHAKRETDCRQADWKWLAETLVISGARTAAVVDAKTERPLAFANEFGGSIADPHEADTQEIARISRAVRRWSRVLPATVEEVVARAGDRQFLIAPVPPDGAAFVYAETAPDESLDLARSAIRSLGR